MITVKELEANADLAKLNLSDEVKNDTADSINALLNMVNTMQSVNTDAIEPMAHPMDSTQHLRADNEDNLPPEHHLTRDALQTIAPNTEAGYYLVPQVVE